MHHPVVGDLDLYYNRVILPSDDGLSITSYTAEPASRSAEALKLLGSWAATLDQTGVAEEANSHQAERHAAPGTAIADKGLSVARAFKKCSGPSRDSAPVRGSVPGARLTPRRADPGA